MMKYAAILFALTLAACGSEPESTQDNQEAPTTIVINNMVKPSCDWETEIYDGDIDQCINRNPEHIVLECGENEVPVRRDGMTECEYIGGCPEGYLVDIQGNGWTCIRQADPVEPECDEGYELFERDGVYYCRSRFMIVCPDGYIPASDFLTYVGCVQREDYDDTADYDQDGYSVADGDCDDTRSDIHPGAPEICGDGIDQDCDGEDLECTPPLECPNGDYEGIVSAELSPASPSGAGVPGGGGLRFIISATQTVIVRNFVFDITLTDANRDMIIIPNQQYATFFYEVTANTYPFGHTWDIAYLGENSNGQRQYRLYLISLGESTYEVVPDHPRIFLLEFNATNNADPGDSIQINLVDFQWDIVDGQQDLPGSCVSGLPVIGDTVTF